jgi:hypothetical protein
MQKDWDLKASLAKACVPNLSDSIQGHKLEHAVSHYSASRGTLLLLSDSCQIALVSFSLRSQFSWLEGTFKVI